MATRDTVLQKIIDDLTNVSTTPTADTAEALALYLKAYRDLRSSYSPGASVYFGVDSGSSDAYAITVSGYTAYTNGDTFIFKANTINTGTANLNVSNIASKTIYKSYDTALENGDIKAGQMVIVSYDLATDSFQLLGTSSSPAGSGTPSAYVSNAVFDPAF